MKTDIHPNYVATKVTCTCGAAFETHSTAENGQIHADVDHAVQRVEGDRQGVVHRAPVLGDPSVQPAHRLDRRFDGPAQVRLAGRAKVDLTVDEEPRRAGNPAGGAGNIEL